MDPAKMKVVDLRSELGALGLDTKGNKPALVERLKKALESKTGKSLPDTTILDTSTEDVEDSPRRPGPAARTRRRSSSTRLGSTPAKYIRKPSPEPIKEVKDEDRYSPGASSDPESESEQQNIPKKKGSPEKLPSPVRSPVRQQSESPEVQDSPPLVQSPGRRSLSPAPVPSSPKSVPNDSPEKADQDDQEVTAPEPKESVNVTPVADADETMEDNSASGESNEAGQEKPDEDAKPMDQDGVANAKPLDQDGVANAKPMDQDEVANDKPMDQDGDAANAEADGDENNDRMKRRESRELTEEEEWDLLNERLEQKEKERIEREKKQAEDDAKKLEEVSDNPVKLNRLKRKHEKKKRWSDFYRSVEVTNEVLTPPTEICSGKKAEDTKAVYVEPELDENKVTLSWYDSDLNQYIELPGLNSVVPMNEGAFSHAWAGARASHGVHSGRVCYEVRLGAVLSSTEVVEKDPITSGIRIGWSTDDQSLNLGEGERSWGYESNARAVNNAEFKEYGKTLEEKDVVGAYLDLECNPCKISYTVNGAEQGVAYEFDKSLLEGKALFPHIITKNICYKVNMGYERYTMNTKTKIIRNRIEIPVEQVLEEKRLKEAELQKQKDDIERRNKERKEKDRKEREERQKKKKEEKEKQEREKKEKEAAERRDRGEEEPEEKPTEKQLEGEMEQASADTLADVDMAVTVKVEPMDQDQPPMPPAEPAPEPTPEPASEPAPEPASEPAADVPPIKEEIAETGEVPEVTEDQILTEGHVLDKRIKFVIRYTVEEGLDGTEACLLPGYLLIAQGALIAGPARPASLADCEVILMVGMPGSGKTHWAKKHCLEHPERRYNVLSTGGLFDKMKVDCKPYRTTYEGRWDAMVSKCAKCVLKLLELAHGRHRNFILDQRRKLREFEGYKRLAVCIVPDEETYKSRCQQRETHDGKEVPDPAIMDMKANITLPEKCSWLDEVIYPDLNEEEAKKVLEGYHKEAKAAGVIREREKRERSANRDSHPAKRQRSEDKRHGRDDRGRSRDFQRGDREDRWGGGGGGGRWGGGGNQRGGGGGGGGSRWGGRDRSLNQNQNSRFDRPWGNNQRGGNDYGSRERDNFRGGNGAGPPGRGPVGPPGHRGMPPGHDPARYSRDNRPGARQPPLPAGGPDRDRRGPPNHQGGGGGGGGGPAGSWHRGGQVSNQRGALSSRGGAGGPPRHKDGANGNQHAQNQQQGWNQWAGGWGGWGNWNQNQGWGNWQNWQNWNQQQGGAQGANNAQPQGGQVASGGKGAQAGGAAAQAAGAAGAGGAQQGQYNYTPQQWYQWQQWQQQQQSWAGYQQQQQGGGNQATNAQDAQQAWAQYYQAYGNAAANAGAATGTDKKS